MQIGCSQLKDELTEDNTVFIIRSHFKKKGIGAYSGFVIETDIVLVYEILDYDFTELSNKEVSAIGNRKDKVKQ